MRSRIFKLLSIVMVIASRAGAQQENEAGYIVKTVPLHRLGSVEAVQLLSPYMIHRGGVYPTGSSLHAVTLRATPATIAEMEKLLAQYDRAPENVTLQFQLIAADGSNTRDPAVSGLDDVLRGVLKFTGYRQLGSALASASDQTTARLTMTGDGQEYGVVYDIENVESATATSAGSVHIRVSLSRSTGIMNGSQSIEKPLFSTGLTVPMGHTVVLGSVGERLPPGTHTSGKYVNGVFVPDPNTTTQPPTDRALILTLRPQFAQVRKDE